MRLHSGHNDDLNCWMCTAAVSFPQVPDETVSVHFFSLLIMTGTGFELRTKSPGDQAYARLIQFKFTCHILFLNGLENAR